MSEPCTPIPPNPVPPEDRAPLEEWISGVLDRPVDFAGVNVDACRAAIAIFNDADHDLLATDVVDLLVDGEQLQGETDISCERRTQFIALVSQALRTSTASAGTWGPGVFPLS
jgi:hypothetical protein